MTERYEAAMLDLAKRLIKLNTVDPPGLEQAAAECVAEVLGREGIESRLQSIGDRRANLIARVRGAGSEPGLIYSAHFDTIGVNQSDWSVDPFGAIVRDGKLYGRGATDMKAALAAMAYAAIALKNSGQVMRGDLILAFTAAENSSCLGATRMIEADLLANAGALLISEPSSLKLFVSEKGALWLRATARGEYGHNAFSEGRMGDRGNAIIRLGEFLVRLRDLDLPAPRHPRLGPPTINAGIVRGGTSTVLIPATASVDIDIRMVPGLSVETVIVAFQGICGPHITLEVLDSKPPVDTEPNDPFVRLCRAACEATTGEAPEVTGVPYYSDGAIFAPHLSVPMVIIGPGEVGKSGSVDEYVELGKLNKSLAIFTRIAQQYLC